MGLSSYQKQFVQMMVDAAGRVCPKFGIPPEVCVGQSALETGWGGSKKAKTGDTFQKYGTATHWNLWGIKGAGTAGSQVWSTKEYRGKPGEGHWEIIKDTFAAYKNLDDAVEAYCKFLMKDRYAKAREVFAKDPGRFVTYIWASGYATAPDYPNSVMSVMRTLFKNGGGPSYNVTPDDALAKVIVHLQGAAAGSDRMKIRDREMASLFGLTHPA